MKRPEDPVGLAIMLAVAALALAACLLPVLDPVGRFLTSGP